MRRIAFYTLLLALTPNALAQGVTEALFLAELPQVLTASRLATSPLDAPAPVTVIDRETIRASGFTEIHDVLRLVPGFQVADWSEGGPMVAHHGLGTAFPRSLLVMLDGRSLVNPITGTVDWRDLPVRLEDVERIEVVRAPSQASYGAMAYNGAINIITRQPAEDHGAAVSFRLGERGYRDTLVRLARRGEDVDWRLSLSEREATPFQDRGIPHYWRRKTVERQTLRLDAAYRPGLNTLLDLDLALVGGHDRLGSLREPSEPDRKRKVDGRYLQLGWQRNHAADSELFVRYYHYRLERDERYAVPLPPPFLALPIDQGYIIQRDDLEFQQNHAWSERIRGLWGVGVRQDRVSSAHYFYAMGTLEGWQWQVFGNLDWVFHPQWRLNLGGMVERHYNTDTRFSPRLALNHALTPNHALRLSAGRGYRAPTRLEADAYQVYTLGNGIPVRLGLVSPEAQMPEQVKFMEAGYVGRHEDLGLIVDARLFEESYDRFIQTKTCIMSPLPPSPPDVPCDVPRPPGYLPLLEPYKAFAFENQGGARVRGAEVSLDWRHTQLGRLLASYTHTRLVRKGEADKDIPDSAPRHSTSLLWSKAFSPSIGASLGLYRVGKMKWMGDGDWQPAYTRVDARLAWHLGKPGSGDELAITLQNLNGRHFEFKTDSASGRDNYTLRQAFVSLRLAW